MKHKVKFTSNSNLGGFMIRGKLRKPQKALQYSTGWTIYRMHFFIFGNSEGQLIHFTNWNWWEWIFWVIDWTNY